MTSCVYPLLFLYSSSLYPIVFPLLFILPSPPFSICSLNHLNLLYFLLVLKRNLSLCTKSKAYAFFYFHCQKKVSLSPSLSFSFCREKFFVSLYPFTFMQRLLHPITGHLFHLHQQRDILCVFSLPNPSYYSVQSLLSSLLFPLALFLVSSPFFAFHTIHCPFYYFFFVTVHSLWTQGHTHLYFVFFFPILTQFFLLFFFVCIGLFHF